MTIDLTEIIVALIGVLTTILTIVVIPWIRTKIGEKRWDQLVQFAFVAVHAAEQMANAGLLDAGMSKLEYAITQVKETLAKHGITYNDAIIRAVIEAAVLDLKKNKA